MCLALKKKKKRLCPLRAGALTAIMCQGNTASVDLYNSQKINLAHVCIDLSGVSPVLRAVVQNELENVPNSTLLHNVISFISCSFIFLSL